MGKRLHSEDIISLEGYTYVIEVYDSLHNGSSHEFVCEADGFQLIYENTGGELFKPVNASRVEFTIYMKDAQIEQFYNDVITAAENRFLVKITRNGSLFWYGKIVADIGIKEDIARNMKPVYKVVALDGLGLLSQKEYNNNGTAYTGKERLFNHLKNCLAKIGTLGEFTGAADPAIITVVEWHEDNMATGAADDPMFLTRVAHESFWSSDNKGKKTYKSCLQVIESILQIFGARIYQANGAWRIEQITERHNSSIQEIWYDETGAYLSNHSVNYTVNLDQATNSKIVGGEYTYYPPTREVRINFFHENWRNYNEGAIFIDFITPAHVSIYNAEIGTSSTFQITANVTQTITYSGIYTAVFCVFFCEFKVGSRYLKRDITSIFGTNITYSAPEWTTTPSRYHFAYPFQATGSGTQVKNSGVVINTPVLLEGGAPEIKLSFLEFRKMTTGEVTTAGISQTFNIGNVYTRLLHFGNYAEENIGLLYSVTSNNGLNNAEIIEFDTNIGDEPYPGTINRLEIYNGTTWVASNGWRNGISGSYIPILSLCAAEILAVTKRPVEKWLGTIKGQFDARTRFGWSSAHYIFLGGTLTARRDEWNGTYVIISKDSADLTVATPIALGATPGDGKVPFNPAQTPSTFADPANNTTEMNVGGVIGNVMSHVSTLNPVGVGVVTSVALSSAVNAGAFVAGQTVTIVNPFNGATQNLTVTTTNLQGATNIAVTGYSAQAFPEGSYVLVSPQNWTIGDVPPGAEDSTWWDVYAQHWEIDQTNAEQWPIEGAEAVLETNINAGNGTTAGIRFDGDGIQAFNSSSTVPRLSISTDGKLRVLQTSYPTNQAGLIYVKGGILHNDGNLEANKTLPQFGHTKHVSVIGYDVEWSTTNNWPVLAWSTEYEPYVIYRIYYRMQTAGSNNNQVFIQEFDGTTVNTIATITTAGQTYGTIDLSPAFAITTNKYIRFIVNAITGTAPKMLFVEFFIREA